MNDKKTVVLGASEKPGRYAAIAISMLNDKGFEVVPVGLRTGTILGFSILTGQPVIENVHTVTLYIRPGIQKSLYNYIMSLHPKRIIFNPGTENPEFEKMAKDQGIETIEACTLVMLSIGSY
jgi:uncharacterized protein